MINKYPSSTIDELNKLLKEFDLDKEIDDKKIEIYLKSFTHLSYANKHNLVSYESYEFLGDAILQYIVSEYILNILGFDEKLDERGTKIRSKIVNAKSFSDLTKKIGLNKCLLVLNEDEKNNENICSDLYESFVASIYINCGLNKVRSFLKKTLFKKYTKDFILKSTIDEITDNKSKFQEIIQGTMSNRKIEYICKDVKDKKNNKKWECSVNLINEGSKEDNLKYGSGTGNTKKEAEQEAAGQAIKKMSA